ncbi:MAG: DUF4188 domain-containing protein [Propionibacteriales bacterium]|nr:DUF4188 domain-containing protein [Propionibacteriales bacterium]
MTTRQTHRPTDNPPIVFLIGMRFNKWWRPDAWLPAFLAMPRMLKELSRDAESGLLGYRLLLGERGVTVVQYWNDLDHLYDFAGDAERTHRPAWTHFFAVAKRVPGAVGIWHETYEVKRAESIFADMPPTGLGAALGVAPVTAVSHTARQRIATS